MYMIFNDSLHRSLHSFLISDAPHRRICKNNCQESAENREDPPGSRQEPYRSTTVPTHATTCKTNHGPPSPKRGGGGVYAEWRL